MSREPTPVEIWGPAFRWLSDLTVANTQESFRSGLIRCKLCENEVPAGERTAHVRGHARERAAWQKKKGSELRREAKARLALINRERRLEERVLGGMAGRVQVTSPAAEPEPEVEPGELALELEGWAESYLK